MIICKKCSSTRVFGPVYKREYGSEVLVYSCLNCGYQQSEPTADAKGCVHPLMQHELNQPTEAET